MAPAAEEPPKDAVQVTKEKSYIQLHLTAKLDKALLPDLSAAGPPATEELSKILGRMLFWGQASALGDVLLPFSFESMGATAKAALWS